MLEELVQEEVDSASLSEAASKARLMSSLENVRGE